jgi:hypothetical protein
MRLRYHGLPLDAPDFCPECHATDGGHEDSCSASLCPWCGELPATTTITFEHEQVKVCRECAGGEA